jgi:hypothetical protein
VRGGSSPGRTGSLCNVPGTGGQRCGVPVEMHRIALVDALEDLGQGHILCFDQEMDMVTHEDIGIQVEMLALFVGCHELKVLLVVLLILEDLLFLVSAGDNVIKGAGVFDAGFAGHRKKIANRHEGVNNYRFKSDPIRSHTVLSRGVLRGS